MSIKKKCFGVDSKGNHITEFTLENKNGFVAKIIDYGAILTSLQVPDKYGTLEDMVLGFDDISGYQTNEDYFGVTVGRNANRIAAGTFDINGCSYTLEQNEAGNSLHSGSEGYHNRIWSAKVLEETNAVAFFLHSPDGDQGFPGNFNVTVTYRLTDQNAVEIQYDGISDKDTIVNMTNHSYFNLSGKSGKTAMDHRLMIKASHYTPVDVKLIPTGEVLEVASTPMDFTCSKLIGSEIDSDFEQLKLTNGFDHNYCLDKTGNGIEKIAVLMEDISGRTMEVHTDCVGMQFYSGNFIKEKIGKQAVIYQKRCGICLETQYFPDAIHHNGFASPVLRAGEKYHTTTRYQFV